MAEVITYTLNLDTTKMEKSLVDTNKEIQELNASQRELSKNNQKGTKEFVDNAEKLKVLKKSYNENSKAIQNTNKLKKEESGHLEKLKAELSVVTNNINKLSKAELNDVNVGKKMVAKQKALTDELNKTEQAGGNFHRQTGKYSEGMAKMGEGAEQAGGMMSSFGGSMGKLPGLVMNAAKATKVFFTMLLSNPIGLILTLIAALIGVAVAVLSKFQPLLDFIEDKIAYVSGLVDGFVESMKGVGDVIAAVFSGDFAKASELIGDMGDKMIAVAEANEKLTQALREYDAQQKLNDATTAEVTASMKKLEGVYKDQSKSIDERKKAFEDYYAMRKGQAEDDLSAQEAVTNAEIGLINAKYGVEVKNATQVKKLMDEGTILREEGLHLMDVIIKQTELEGKVAEEGAKKAQEGNRLRSQSLRENVNLIKARLKYYEETNQSILENQKTFTEEMLKDEEDRLIKIQNKKIEAARKEFEIIKAEYGTNNLKLKEAELKYLTEKKKITRETNEKIAENQDEHNSQLIAANQEVIDLWKQQNVEALKDNSVATQTELDARIELHKINKDKQLEIVRATAEQEEWSKEKTSLELLKIDQDYINKVDGLNQSLIDNQKKSDKQLIDQKKATDDLILSIHKAFLDNQDLSNQEQLNRELTLIDEKHNNILIKLDEQAVLEDEQLRMKLDQQLITEEEYQTIRDERDAEIQIAKDEAEVVRNEEKKAAKAAALDEELATVKAVAQKGLSILSQINQISIDNANKLKDARIAAATETANKETNILEAKFKQEQALLQAQLDSGLISQEQFDKKVITLQLKKEEKEKEIKNKRIKTENAAGQQAFNSSKNSQKAGIAINAASGIMAAWNTTIPAPAGQILAGIESAIIAGVAIKQISDVNKEKFTPKPLIAAGGGILNGSLHAAGGVNMGAVEAEGGEFIINRASTQEFAPLLNSINDAGNSSGDVNEVSPLIDYNLLAATLQSKKIYVVSHEITDQQDTDVEVQDRVSF